MRAIYYDEFRGPVCVQNVTDPAPTPDGVVIRVEASGLYRSLRKRGRHVQVGLFNETGVTAIDDFAQV